MVKKVAIIGAGASGLTALKVCCVEYGFDAWCLEKTHDLGGLWRYKPSECDGEASVMKSTVINTTKEMMAYSDFPPSAEYPNFMHNRDVMAYFRSYAESFDLLQRIRYNTQVLCAKRADDYDTTGRWQVTTKDLRSGTVSVEVYDVVFTCTGHHADPYYPEIPGLDSFTGRVVHSHSYKDPQGFEDKRVVVVGIGNSGGDISVELSRVTEKLYLVTRRGSWVLHRIYDNGYPWDMVINGRFMQTVISLFPNLAAAFIEHKANSRFDHEKYGLKPRHHVFQQHPTVNDELPSRIQCGTVIVKPTIKAIHPPNTVQFEDGSKAGNIDAIIMATGYSFGFPYLEDGKLIPVEENRIRLYKQMFVPDLAHPETLVIIGCFQPVGALMPISEMQTRVACELLKENAQHRLPCPSAMHQDITAKMQARGTRYVESRRHTIQMDYIGFMDELAAMIGATPSPLRYLITDPALSTSLMFGPCTPYQYRLQGPNPWPGARDAQVKVWDRAWHPTKTKIGACDPGARCCCPAESGCKVNSAVKTMKGIICGIFLFLLIVGWAFIF